MEDLARAALVDSHKTFAQQGRINVPIAALCANYGTDLLKRQDRHVREPLEAVVSDAVTKHHKKINDNHGIKERNVLSLFLPLGLKYSALDPIWLADLDSFGSRRGDTAHRSYGSQVQPDPVQERVDVRRIINGLVWLDGDLRRLCKADIPT